MNSIQYFLLIFCILSSACGQSNTKRATIVQHLPISDTTEICPATLNISRLDSIENANNKSVYESKDNLTKAFVLLSYGDSTIHLTANIRKDHRIFGYAKPDINSEQLLLFSVFTSDVENNPFGCKLGAYYDTSSIREFTLKYTSQKGSFIQASATDTSGQSTVLYFDKKWIVFE
jgi:hypothetical protein